ncbi:MAG: sensor histidine kinase N-terminal domain-containing protein [Proteobacteria bacterium]|nr:sensor histidine kinase N-terminal domain-containing protein [Pseudomonadota bacterium]
MSTPSLRRRLLTFWLASLAGLWLVSAGLVGWGVYHELKELLDDRLEDTATLLLAQSDSPPPAPRPAREAEEADARVVYQVYQDGRLIGRSGGASDAQPLLPPNAAAGHHTLTHHGERWRIYVAHDPARGRTALAGETIAARRHVLNAVWAGMGWPLALALPLLALLGHWAIGRALSPLHTLSLHVAARDPAALRPVGLDGVPSEVVPLVQALNALFARVEATLAGERRFTADAAHELRTPIAAIRAQAQAALTQPQGDAHTHALAGVLQGCDRAARLVTQLLALARLDAQAQAPVAPAACLATVARLVLAELAPAALARQQELGLEAPAHAHVAADEAQLAMLVRNLTDNALRYSPEGARIEVTIAATPGTTTLTVADSGPGLGDADLARLGERFFRVLGHEASGSGLGWSIVRRLAESRGWQVVVDRTPQLGGLRVTVTLATSGG